MTARQFLNQFRPDERLTTGGFYSQDPVRIEPDDRVGVVLMNLGGPLSGGDVKDFLYNRFMDPAAVDLPVPALLRDRLARFLAKKRAARVSKDFEQIGGSSPLSRHSREQARALELRLNDRFGPLTGASFKTYVSTRYGQPCAKDTLRAMAVDRITKVVLLPLHPHYGRSTTGSSLAYWEAHEEPTTSVSTTFVYEYATHPKYIQALSERIDEGLQRFSVTIRDRVPLVFSAQGAPLKDMMQHRDPYCCLVHSTVQQVMAYRAAADPERNFRVCFQEPQGLAKGLSPLTSDTLEILADEGQTDVLVVPVSFVTDHIESVFALDIALREEAHTLGFEQYEVTNGLNCHPLFIEALAECVAAQMTPVRVAQGDGAGDGLPASLTVLPRYAVSDRTVRCHQCPFVCEAHDWSNEPAVRVPAPLYPAPGSVPSPQRAA